MMLLATRRTLAVQLMACAVIFWPAPSSAQSEPVRHAGRSQAAFTAAPGAIESAPQIASGIELTDAVKARFNNLLDRFRRGDRERVAVEAVQLREQVRQASGTDATVMFRVGMFFEHVTLSMLALFSQSSEQAPCDASLMQAVEADLQALESSGASSGAVFGRAAFVARCRPPGTS